VGRREGRGGKKGKERRKGRKGRREVGRKEERKSPFFLDKNLKDYRKLCR
jgi:hypothetical protein